MGQKSTFKIRVYRIEKDGKGPFHNCDRYVFMNWFSPPTNPRHIRCTIDYENHLDYVFGCTSKEELIEYFSAEDIERLVEIGYEIKSFLVEEDLVLLGDGECAMPRNKLPKTHQLYRQSREERYTFALNPVEIVEGKPFNIDMRLMV